MLYKQRGEEPSMWVLPSGHAVLGPYLGFLLHYCTDRTQVGTLAEFYTSSMSGWSSSLLLSVINVCFPESGEQYSVRPRTPQFTIHKCVASSVEGKLNPRAPDGDATMIRGTVVTWRGSSEAGMGGKHVQLTAVVLEGRQPGKKGN